MKRASALTLVETLVAMAIVSVLMVAALALLTRLSRDEALVRGSSSRAGVDERLKEVLVSDLRHAEGCRAIPTGVELRLYAALMPADLESRHLPSVVRYEVRELAGRRWLVRTQDSPLCGNFGELVCSGVATVSMAPASPPEGSKVAAEGRAARVLAVRFDDPGRRPVTAALGGGGEL